MFRFRYGPFQTETLPSGVVREKLQEQEIYVEVKAMRREYAEGRDR